MKIVYLLPETKVVSKNRWHFQSSSSIISI